MDTSAQEFLSQLRQLAPRPAYALAVSGGADSMGLLALAASLQQAKPAPRFVVFNVDHGLNPQSKAWQAQVLSQARALGFTAEGLCWNGRQWTTRVQEEARHARYSLMAQACMRLGLDVLLSAHHLEDQAETILFRLARGSSLAGLRGMRPLQYCHGIWLLRPCLDWPKARLKAQAQAAGLAVIMDAANTDRRYARARLRHHAPSLRGAGLTPQTIQAFAKKMHRADIALCAQTDHALERLCTQDSYGLVHMDKQGFLDLPTEIAYRVLQHILGRHRPDSYPIRERQLAHICEGLARATQRAWSLAGFIVRARADTILMYREPHQALALAPYAVRKHQVCIWDGRMAVKPPYHGSLAALGEHGIAQIKAQTTHLPAIPKQALLGAPALWNKQQLLASPFGQAQQHLLIQPLSLVAKNIPMRFAGV